MKKSVVIKAKRIKPLKKAQIDYKPVLFLILFLCGIIIGVTILKKSDETTCNIIFTLIKRSLFTLKDCSLIKVFSGVFINLFLILFCVFIFGLCCLGAPFIWSIPVFWGLFSGIVVSAFYLLFGFRGIGYFALINLPCYAITAATLIRGCCIGTEMCNEIFLNLLSGECKDNNKNAIKTYSVNFLVLLIILSISALIKAGSCTIFDKLFALI